MWVTFRLGRRRTDTGKHWREKGLMLGKVSGYV